MIQQTRMPSLPSMAEILARVRENLPQGIAFDVGPEHLDERRAPPRCVWVALTDSSAFPENTNAGPHRMVWGADCVWECYLFAREDGPGGLQLQSFRALESFRSLMLSAVHTAARGNLVSWSGRWLQQDSAAIGTYGRGYVLTCTFRCGINLIDPGTALAQILDVGLDADVASAETPTHGGPSNGNP